MKRFFDKVSTRQVDDGHTVMLDDRPIRTPAKKPFVLPSRELADLVAAEWAAQAQTIDQTSMPATRLATTAIDIMPDRRGDAIAEIAGFLETDLLCYRAAEPSSLVALQSSRWDPWLLWAQEECGLSFNRTDALLAIEQPASTLERGLSELEAMDDWRLVGFHDAVTSLGSFVLGLAVFRQALDPLIAAELSRLDELFEMSRWGTDPEQEERHARIDRELVAIGCFFSSLE